MIALSGYQHRTAAIRPTYVAEGAPTLVGAPPGEDVPSLGRSAKRQLERLSDDKLLYPTADGLPKGSSFTEGWAAVERWLAVAEELQAVLAMSDHPWAHLEADQARKICLQRGGAPGWNLLADGLVHTQEVESMKEGFSAVAELLGNYAADPPSYRYKQGTNHGWPDRLSTTTSFVLHALWARAVEGLDPDAFLNLGMALADRLDESETPFGAQMLTRTGPSAKQQPMLMPGSVGIMQFGTMLGRSPRRRIVYGMPTAGNMLQLEFINDVKGRLRRCPHLWHFGPQDIAFKVHAWHRPGMKWYSDDISGYDQSVSPLHLGELNSHVIVRFAGAEAAVWKQFWNAAPLLGPAVREAYAAYLYRKVGMISSGDLATSSDGTLINAARIFECYARATGQSVASAKRKLGRTWTFLVQGDDTVIGTMEKFDKTKYVETSAAMGYKTKLVDGVVFLMHLVDPERGTWTPLASRVLQQTVFNEYPGDTLALELLSFSARARPQFWAVNPWAGWLQHKLSDSPLFRHWRCSPSSARRRVAAPDVQAEITRDLKVARSSPSRWEIGDATTLSDAVAHLLASNNVPLPTALTPSEAREAALGLADWMGSDDRTQPPRLSRAAALYWEAARQGSLNEEINHDEADGRHPATR